MFIWLDCLVENTIKESFTFVSLICTVVVRLVIVCLSVAILTVRLQTFIHFHPQAHADVVKFSEATARLYTKKKISHPFGIHIHRGRRTHGDLQWDCCFRV